MYHPRRRENGREPALSTWNILATSATEIINRCVRVSTVSGMNCEASFTTLVLSVPTLDPVFRQPLQTCTDMIIRNQQIDTEIVCRLDKLADTASSIRMAP